MKYSIRKLYDHVIAGRESPSYVARVIIIILLAIILIIKMDKILVNLFPAKFNLNFLFYSSVFALMILFDYEILINDIDECTSNYFTTCCRSEQGRTLNFVNKR